MASVVPSVVPDIRSGFGIDVAVGRVAAVAPALATLALGVILLFLVGFLQVPAVHNGVHDTRHANGFPCH